jgi:hypothetical protein
LACWLPQCPQHVSSYHSRVRMISAPRLLQIGGSAPGPTRARTRAHPGPVLLARCVVRNDTAVHFAAHSAPSGGLGLAAGYSRPVGRRFRARLEPPCPEDGPRVDIDQAPTLAVPVLPLLGSLVRRPRVIFYERRHESAPRGLTFKLAPFTRHWIPDGGGGPGGGVGARARHPRVTGTGEALNLNLDLELARFRIGASNVRVPLNLHVQGTGEAWETQIQRVSCAC